MTPRPDRKSATWRGQVIPQPHGGALVPGAGRGPTPGAPNAGRPPSEVRAALRQAFADRLPIITGIADDAMLPPTDRLRALEVMARHGLGTVTELGVDDVRDKLAATVAAIRRTVPPDVAAPLLVELRTVWTT